MKCITIATIFILKLGIDVRYSFRVSIINTNFCCNAHALFVCRYLTVECSFLSITSFANKYFTKAVSLYLFMTTFKWERFTKQKFLTWWTRTLNLSEDLSDCNKRFTEKQHWVSDTRQLSIVSSTFLLHFWAVTVYNNKRYDQRELKILNYTFSEPLVPIFCSETYSYEGWIPVAWIALHVCFKNFSA